jgi:hypothetical protein
MFGATTAYVPLEPEAPLAGASLPEYSSGEVAFEDVGVSDMVQGGGDSQGRLISAAAKDVGPSVALRAPTSYQRKIAIR